MQVGPVRSNLDLEMPAGWVEWPLRWRHQHPRYVRSYAGTTDRLIKISKHLYLTIVPLKTCDLGILQY
jgi:hypothetical protein